MQTTKEDAICTNKNQYKAKITNVDSKSKIKYFNDLKKTKYLFTTRYNAFAEDISSLILNYYNIFTLAYIYRSQIRLKICI